jgi:serine/threonine protein kinase
VILGGPYSTKSDIYGIGIVLWEMINRCIKGFYERPFEEYTDMKYDFQILVQAAQEGKRPTIPPSCPPRFAQLILRLFESEAPKRPNCDEILVELYALEGEYKENKEDWNQRRSLPPLEKVEDSKKKLKELEDSKRNEILLEDAEEIEILNRNYYLDFSYDDYSNDSANSDRSNKEVEEDLEKEEEDYIESDIRIEKNS